MTLRTRIFHLLVGVVLLTSLLASLFALTLPMLHRWGATDAEVASALPGDELLSQPLIHWTHGIDINAPPEAVWPWIAQLGDTRVVITAILLLKIRWVP